MIKNKIKTLKVIDIKEECKDVKTFTLKTSDFLTRDIEKPQPGQFLMLWVPGVDEVPMSFSGVDNMGNWQITVKRVGDCTESLFKIKKQDFVGVRGPLGNSFTLPKDKNSKSFLVGGGTGLAPLRFLAKELKKNDYNFTLLEGAKVQKELIYVKEFNDIDTYFCTEDGSYGEKGLVTEVFKSLLTENLEENKKIFIYSCGPEKMLYEIYKLSQKFNLNLEVSLERMMRCGCGLCGLCSLDPIGFLVCKDGPVFSKKQLSMIDDFGKFKRDLSGKKIEI